MPLITKGLVCNQQDFHMKKKVGINIGKTLKLLTYFLTQLKTEQNGSSSLSKSSHGNGVWHDYRKEFLW